MPYTPPDQEYLLLLLVTPGLLSQDGLVQGLLKHYFADPRHVSVSVLVACVDALPYPKGGPSRSETDLIFSNPLGYNGVSIAILELEKAAPQLWSDLEHSEPKDLNEGAIAHLSLNICGVYIFVSCQRLRWKS